MAYSFQTSLYATSPIPPQDPLGREDPKPSPRVGFEAPIYGFRKETIAAMRRNGRDAP